MVCGVSLSAVGNIGIDYLDLASIISTRVESESIFSISYASCAMIAVLSAKY